jgi:hypothetical protein
MEEKKLTREEFKQLKTAEEPKQERIRKIRIRLIPIWLRLLIVTLLIIVSIVSGAMVGYSVFGGGDASDVFRKSTWSHIIDLVNKDI